MHNTRQTAIAVARCITPPLGVMIRPFDFFLSIVMAEREGVIANLTEQRMAEQMAILEKFYNHYDSQQWHAVIEMEGQVRDACAATLTCAAIMLNL
jgi:hypothetical protein